MFQKEMIHIESVEQEAEDETEDKLRWWREEHQVKKNVPPGSSSFDERIWDH